jgi:hypothetical protein
MIEKIVSGGQTGADRAALDWAIAREIPYGGWCPKGRRAEDGMVPARYKLRETTTANYLQRTEQNVVDSDGTVALSMRPVLTGGSKRTAAFAAKHLRPLLHLHAGLEDAAMELERFVRTHRIKILNCAGPRASGEPGIAEFVMRVLEEAFRPGNP